MAECKFFPFSSKTPHHQRILINHTTPLIVTYPPLRKNLQGGFCFFQRQTHCLPRRVELHCERPTTNLILTKICARTKILKFWSQIRFTLGVGGRVWLVPGWFGWSLINAHLDSAQIGPNELGSHVSAYFFKPGFFYLMFDAWCTTLHPQICPKKSGLVHGITFSRSQLKSAHPHCL